MRKNIVWTGLALSLLGFLSTSTARADEWDKKTILTFSQPVEIPGHVLPAGTYMFKLNDTMSDRHIVQVFNADGSQIIATVMAIPNSRLTATDETVIRFHEMRAGSPEAIRAWFYPGNTVGQEFVYSKRRALVLARAEKASVPSIEAEAASADELNTATIVAVSPDDQAAPVVAGRTAPAPIVADRMAPAERVARVRSDDDNRLPKTASTLPLVVLLGLGAIGVAFGLMAFGKHSASA